MKSRFIVKVLSEEAGPGFERLVRVSFAWHAVAIKKHAETLVRINRSPVTQVVEDRVQLRPPLCAAAPDVRSVWLARAGCARLTIMLGRLHHAVLGCWAPAAVAAFYSKLLGQPITYHSHDCLPSPHLTLSASNRATRTGRPPRS